MSTIRRSFGLIVSAAALLAACSVQPTASTTPMPTQEDNRYAPQPGDTTMMQSIAEIVSASVVMTEAIPPQISVSLAYRLVTPCNQLRVNISQPDSANRIQMEIYGVAPKDMPCTLMALATPQEASINLGSFPGGQYTVWANGVKVGEFSS
ncbi:MAG: hypothetical protein ABSG01_16405 [Anaerolineales bacterium]